MSRPKLNVIDKSQQLHETINALRSYRISKRSRIVPLEFGHIDHDKNEVIILSKLKIEPRSLFDLAMRLIDIAVFYEKKTGIKVTPEDFELENSDDGTEKNEIEDHDDGVDENV